ncbi:MAG TPA: hypothetical protein PK324_17935, partial [Nocardioides sp.]|nr:hypothetical protein [Nocardioides sp.]
VGGDQVDGARSAHSEDVAHVGIELADVDADQLQDRRACVGGAVDAEGVKRPGLLLEWRQVRGRWEGRVLYVARLRPLDAGGGWVAVEEWLPAELLLPL